MLLKIRLFHNGYIRQIAIVVIVVQTITDNELVWDIEHAVVRFELHLACPLFVQEHCCFQGPWSEFLESLGNFEQRFPRVVNVIDKQDIAVLDVEPLDFFDMQLSGRDSSSIRRSSNQADAKRHFQAADQVGEHHQTTGHDRYDGNRLWAVLSVELGTELVDPTTDLFLVDQYFHTVLSASCFSADDPKLLVGSQQQYVLGSDQRRSYRLIGANRCDFFKLVASCKNRHVASVRDVQQAVA
jgi:hypothetical protein